MATKGNELQAGPRRWWRAAALGFLLALTASMSAGCAAAPRGPAQTAASTTARSSVRARDAASGDVCDPERDRAAIRAMAGEFHVTFSFEETESLKPGYTVKPPYRTAGSEVVQILDETPRKIVLQHVLVLAGPNGTPVAQKHWRQDWTFQDDDLVEFRGRRSFSHRHLSANEVRCAWSQAVFEVTDAPRYESVGRWTHAGGVSTWASAETWRPLPRREYTKRSDYDVIVGTNRHVVSDSGWSHEQDNVKLVLDGNHPLARERGLNRYERTSLATAEVARAYLRETGAFWSGVRDAWRDAFARNERFVIRPDDAIAEPHEDLFTLARASAGGNVEARVARARALIDRAVQPSGGPAHASLSQMAPH